MLEKRALGCDSETLARDLLFGFYDVCMRSGLDGILSELEQAFAPLEITDGQALAEEPRLREALVGKLADFDHGGPRNTKPQKLADALIASLGLTLTDAEDRTVTLDDDVRTQVMAALTAPIQTDLAVPRIREAIIAGARTRCEPAHLAAFDKHTAQLDESGMRVTRQLKLPLHAVQAVEHALFESRQAVVERAANVALDRAQQVLAKVAPDAAGRIDQPITHKLTPRDVAIRRANESRVPKVPARIAQSLFESLTELAHLAWRPLEQPVRPYAASQVFAVGDVVEHPKFGRGAVISSAAKRIEVEFESGKATLVHGHGR